ncbi:hypothetical protein Lade_0885 [Legionella adelaidensis]|uniref:Uncharacterized protein n=1 Tax=Legionella adelaidensis TaxID=45056 RepID=A0A0W0R570_9GAMM|nr:hypothetical protein [Legionella adelaidensis]KTC66227.1 hypothetical protein Lade_0885 [Legionella adelaidensis]
MLSIIKKQWDDIDEHKLDSYVTYGLMKKDYWDDPKPRPGFFAPYRSFSDFRKQLKAPIQMPLLNIAVGLMTLVGAISDAASALLDLATLDFSQFKKNSGNFALGLLNTFLIAANAIIDTIIVTLGLLTRTLATGGKFIKDVGTGIASCFSSSEEEAFGMEFK